MFRPELKEKTYDAILAFLQGSEELIRHQHNGSAEVSIG